MTSEREEVIDFVAPYFEQSGILIGKSIWTHGAASHHSRIMRKRVREAPKSIDLSFFRAAPFCSAFSALFVVLSLCDYSNFNFISGLRSDITPILYIHDEFIFTGMKLH